MKILPGLIFLSTIFISGCYREYFDTWERFHTEVRIQTWSTSPLTGELLILPNARELEALIERLEKAKERIWIETYTWTEKTTLSTVIAAKEKGIDVRVILEGNVYQTPRINDSTVQQLKERDIPVVYASDGFSFTHMKLWIIDYTWCISTWNWSYTSFTKNREFIFCSTDISILEALEEIFLSDFKHLPPVFLDSWLDSRIGLAPLNLRKFITENLETAKSEVLIYNQTVSDSDIIQRLSAIQKQGLRVEICQSRTSYSEWEYLGLPVYTSNSPYLHAKVFLIDGKDVILGSANMTQNALDNNREIMIKIENNAILYKKIKNLYNIDCKGQP